MHAGGYIVVMVIGVCVIEGVLCLGVHRIGGTGLNYRPDQF